MITLGKPFDYGKNFRETCFGFYEKDGKILLTKNSIKKEIAMVGGGIEPNESHEQCLAREFLEESGYKIKSIKSLFTIQCFWKPQNKTKMCSLAHFYLVDVFDQNITPTEVGHSPLFVDTLKAKDLLPLPYHKKAMELYYLYRKTNSFSEKDLNDNGYCPTCFNRQTDGLLFGDESQKRFYQDNDIECVFVSNPRANGHVAIITKKHFDDMTKCPNRINHKIMDFAKQLMIIIKDVFGCEKVYLCTMCDGVANHYHIQLIPRYSFEERGSKNFVKPRQEYVFDKQKFEQVKQQIAEYASKRR